MAICAVFGLSLVVYFLITSGVMVCAYSDAVWATGAVTLHAQYDFVVKPPGMGGVRHPRTGAYRPEPFMKVLLCIAADVCFDSGPAESN